MKKTVEFQSIYHLNVTKKIHMWIPKIEFSLQVTDKEKILYQTDDHLGIYHAHRWPYRKGRHEKGEFPVVVVRKHFMDCGYKVWVSGQSKMGIDSFILAMFPGARSRRDQSYINTVNVFGKEVIRKFIAIIEAQKKKKGLPRHGGDPDLLVQNPENLSDRFFVEVKAEDFTGRRPYKDKINEQQDCVFPLIEEHLKCQVQLAKVLIVTESKIYY